MSALTTIEGIGPVTAEKLKESGVASTEALLTEGATPAGRKEIAETSGIDEKRILKFVNHADLMRVKGVGGEYAELLEAAGVDSVPELSQRSPENLAGRMATANEAKGLVRLVPSIKAVTNWVNQAKTLDRVVSH